MFYTLLRDTHFFNLNAEVCFVRRAAVLAHLQQQRNNFHIYNKKCVSYYEIFLMNISFYLGQLIKKNKK